MNSSESYSVGQGHSFQSPPPINSPSCQVILSVCGGGGGRGAQDTSSELFIILKILGVGMHPPAPLLHGP